MASKYFTKDEVSNLIWEHEKHRTEHENRRWSRTVTSIVKDVDGKFYAIDWDEGLTEMQENMYESGEYPEVEKVSGYKGVYSETWVVVNEDNKSSLENSVNDMLILTPKDEVKKAIDSLDKIDLDLMLEVFDNLSALNINEDLDISSKVSKQYFKNLIKIKELLEKKE